MLFILLFAWLLVVTLNERQNVPIPESPPASGSIAQLGLCDSPDWMTLKASFAPAPTSKQPNESVCSGAVPYSRELGMHHF
jgi:hypothetical protein